MRKLGFKPISVCLQSLVSTPALSQPSRARSWQGRGRAELQAIESTARGSTEKKCLGNGAALSQTLLRNQSEGSSRGEKRPWQQQQGGRGLRGWYRAGRHSKLGLGMFAQKPNTFHLTRFVPRTRRAWQHI